MTYTDELKQIAQQPMQQPGYDWQPLKVGFGIAVVLVGMFLLAMFIIL